MSEEYTAATECASKGVQRSTLSIMVVVIVVGWLATSLSSLDDQHNWGDDWSHYVAQARGLAEGSLEQELARSIFRNTHSTAPFGPTVVPWGLPLILAPVYAASDGDLSSLKVPACVFYALFLITIYVLFKDRLDDISRLLLLAMFALNPTFFHFRNQILTDIPFLFLSTFSLLLIDRCIVQRRFFVHPLVDGSMLGAAISLACLTRTMGFLLLATVGAAQILRWVSERPSNLRQYLFGHRREALIYIVAFLGLVLAGALLPSTEVSVSAQFAYLSEDAIGEIATRLFERMQVYALLPQAFFRSEFIPPTAATALAGFTLAFAVLGVVRRIGRDAVFVVYCALSFGVLILTDFFGGLRYVFPILPFLLYFAIAGLTPSAPKRAGAIQVGWRRWPFGRLLAAGLVLLFAADAVVALARPPSESRDFDPFGKDGSAMLEYIANETDEDAVVIFFKPRAMTYLTKRRAIVVSRFDQVFDGRADYIVLAIPRVRDQLSPQAPFWRERRSDYDVVFQNRLYQIFDLRRGARQQRQ